MNITPEFVKKVAVNARIKIKEEEAKEFAKEMSEILAAFEKLSELDTKDTEPSYHPITLKNITREDVVGESTKKEEALALTQHTKNGYFRGPKAIQK